MGLGWWWPDGHVGGVLVGREPTTIAMFVSASNGLP